VKPPADARGRLGPGAVGENAPAPQDSGAVISELDSGRPGPRCNHQRCRHVRSHRGRGVDPARAGRPSRTAPTATRAPGALRGSFRRRRESPPLRSWEQFHGGADRVVGRPPAAKPAGPPTHPEAFRPALHQPSKASGSSQEPGPARRLRLGDGARPAGDRDGTPTRRVRAGRDAARGERPESVLGLLDPTRTTCAVYHGLRYLPQRSAAAPSS
jgi:hypothetical protein